MPRLAVLLALAGLLPGRPAEGQITDPPIDRLRPAPIADDTVHVAPPTGTAGEETRPTCVGA